MALREDAANINLSGISVSGVGGLGLVAIAVLTTWVLPQAWWLVAFGAAGGCLLGLAIVTFRRHHTPAGPSGDDPHILFRAPTPADAPAAPDAARRDLRLATATLR